MSDNEEVVPEEEVEPKIIMTPAMVGEGLSMLYRIPGKYLIRSLILRFRWLYICL